MQRFSGSLAILAALVLFPASVFAQASLTGTVKDASGAVLPGVTVEAASPVLIEKVRSVVTDGSGGYRIVDLRPGPYTVTFTLPGFTTLKRDGIELTGSITALVDAELRVGALEETITVTGEAPAVDVQSTTKQQVISSELIDALPTGRSTAALGVLIAGVNASAVDVGGTLGGANTQISAHGGRAGDQRMLQNGSLINDVQTATAGQSGATPNLGAAAEVTIDTSSLSAEQPTGGVFINYILRDGGNSFKGTAFAAFANEHMTSSNFTQRLKDRGLTAVNSIQSNWDINPGFGGPIKRDKLWFYAAARDIAAHNYAAGMFYNKNAFKPNVWTYEPDPSRPALSQRENNQDEQIRVTWQATQKHKITGSIGNNTRCRCPNGISATVSPEAAADGRYLQQVTLIGEWKAPLTNRLLGEAVGFHKSLRWGGMHMRPTGSQGGGSLEISPEELAIYPTLVGVTEQSSGLNYHGPGTVNNTVLGAFNNTTVPNYTYRAALSYVTGSHTAKVGYQDTIGFQQARTYAYEVPYRYRFNNGVPNQITVFATPWTAKNDQHHDIGIFVQDRWTINRMTLTGGARFDYFNTGYPEQILGPATLVPNRNWTFPAEDNLNWKDFSWRTGWSYDLLGDGKTAVKVSLNKYLAGVGLGGGIGSNTNPITRLTNTTTRTWTDANRDFIPQCDLINPDANGECAAMANRAFGTQTVSQVTDTALRDGWGVRGFNWEFATGLQREIAPRIAVDVAYYRRWYGNFAATDDLNLSPADLDPFSITAPVDSRLPGGGGNTITGLYDRKPSAFGRPVNNITTLSDHYGKQTELWNGFDVSLQARLTNGLTMQGGVSSGKTTTDNCEILAKLPEMALLATSTPYCHVEEPMRTQVKALGTYIIPRADVQVSATFQSIPSSTTLAANYNVPSAEAARTLGRPLAGGAANATVNLVAPGVLYGERINQIDLRVGKILRLGQRRATVSLDIYNLTNGDTVTAVNTNYATLWRPTTVLQARFLKISTQIDF